ALRYLTDRHRRRFSFPCVAALPTITCEPSDHIDTMMQRVLLEIAIDELFLHRVPDIFIPAALHLDYDVIRVEPLTGGGYGGDPDISLLTSAWLNLSIRDNSAPRTEILDEPSSDVVGEVFFILWSEISALIPRTIVVPKI